MSERFMVVSILVVLIMSFLFPYTLLMVDKIKGTCYSCSIFRWHDGKGGTKSFDGCSVHATCSKCGEEVMQDGQGELVLNNINVWEI